MNAALRVRGASATRATSSMNRTWSQRSPNTSSAISRTPGRKGSVHTHVPRLVEVVGVRAQIAVEVPPLQSSVADQGHPEAAESLQQPVGAVEDAREIAPRGTAPAPGSTLPPRAPGIPGHRSPRPPRAGAGTASVPADSSRPSPADPCVAPTRTRQPRIAPARARFTSCASTPPTCPQTGPRDRPNGVLPTPDPQSGAEPSEKAGSERRRSLGRVQALCPDDPVAEEAVPWNPSR